MPIIPSLPEQYNAARLIRDALVLAQVVSQEDEYDGRYVEDGLIYLNEILAQWSESQIYIPYVDFLSFPLTTGKFMYRAGPLPTADIITNRLIAVTEGNVQFGGTNIVKNYLRVGTYVQHNMFNYNIVAGIPNDLFINLQSLHTDLYFFPTPSQNFICNLTCKLGLGELTLYEEMVKVPRSYRLALRYILAGVFSDVYNTICTQKFYNQVDKQTKFVEQTSKVDLSMHRDMSLTGRSSLIYNPAAYYWGGGFT